MFSKALTFPSPRFDSIWVIGQPGRNGGTSRAGEAPGTSCLGSRVGPGAGGSPSRALAVPKQSDSASTCATCSLAPGIRVAGRALPPAPRRHPPFHIVVSRDQGQATAAPPLSASQPRPSSPRERKADTKAELPPNWGPENRGPQTTQGSGHTRPPRGLFQGCSGASDCAARVRLSGFQQRVGAGWEGSVKWKVGASALGVRG